MHPRNDIGGSADHEDGGLFDTLLEACNDINNVLTWSCGTFRVANEALAFYAKELGFLDVAYFEAIREARGIEEQRA